MKKELEIRGRGHNRIWTEERRMETK